MTNKILIIDTSEHFMEILKVRLQSYGYDNIISSRSGNEGYNKVVREKPDLVIIDTRLSDVDGYLLCKQIRSISGDHIKIILMGTFTHSLDLDRAQQMGADDLVPKTFDCMSLMVGVKRLIDQFEVV